MLMAKWDVNSTNELHFSFFTYPSSCLAPLLPKALQSSLDPIQQAAPWAERGFPASHCVPILQSSVLDSDSHAIHGEGLGGVGDF